MRKGGVTEIRGEEAERGREGLLPGDEGRRTERREEREGEERTENEEEEEEQQCGVVFQVQRVTGHDVHAVPPTVPPEDAGDARSTFCIFF